MNTTRDDPLSDGREGRDPIDRPYRTQVSAANVTIRIVGGVEGVERMPELAEHFGRWLTRYEPELAPKGEQWIFTTNDRDEALKLPFSKASELIRTTIGTRPWDGKPDRPISVFHLAITREDVEDAA